MEQRDVLPLGASREEIAQRRARRRREEKERRARLRRKRMLQTALVAAVGVVVVLVATSGGGGPARRSHAHFKQHASGYTWAADFGGSQPTIQDENKKPGTAAWQLPGGRARGSITGYVGSESIRPGETQRVFVDAGRSRHFDVDVYRLGWYGGRGGRLVLSSRRMAAHTQPPCRHDGATGLVSCHWHTTLGFRIPSGLPSGVYVVKLSGDRNTGRYALFVVESSRPRPMLAELPTTTYQAYNSWGGDSLYPGGQTVGVTGTGQGVEVSFDRPYKTTTGAGQLFSRDIAMLRFLEREGYDASYTTGASIDARPDQVLGHRMLLDWGHSEYWSQRTADAFRRARDRGTNLAFLSSNTMVWRVRYLSGGHRVVGYKEHARLDPDQANPTGLMPQAGAPLTGSSWQMCVTPRYPGLAGTKYRYYPWQPAAALQPSWLFKDTGLTATSQVPGIVGYEPDRTSAFSPRGTQVVGGGITACQGHGVVPSGASQSTLYTAPSGALVFSSGTLGWQLGLSPVPYESPDAPSRADVRLIKLTKNLFGRMLGS